MSKIMDDNPKHPYELLRDLDYEDYVEKKGRFDFLTWAKCWDLMKSVCPRARYEVVDYLTSNGNTVPYMACEKGAIVHVILYYEDEEQDPIRHHEYLAIRGYDNKVVNVPDAAQIENCIRRCVAKAVSMATGYGITLWFGEDIKALDYRPETRLDGSVAKNGEMTVDQGIKLDRLIRNRLVKEEEKESLREWIKAVPTFDDASEQIIRLVSTIETRKLANQAIKKEGK
jgi:hypothetical protein